MSDVRKDGGATPRKLLSVVTPCYNEENNVEACWTRLRAILEAMPDYDYEHIFADNCSTDRTPEILREIAAKDHRVKVIFNAANFGAARSLLNAQRAASGDVVVAYMPADLQDPPELIPDMVALWERGYQVVYGVRADRDENKLLFALRRLFYRIVNASARFQVPVNAGDFQVVDRTVIEALRHSRDYYPYVRGMIASYGFRSIGVNYKMTRRTADKSKANWFVLIDQAINAVISVSQTPLRIAMFVGFCLALLSVLYGLLQLILVLFLGVSAPPGVTTLMIAVFFLSGGQLFFMGLIGEYVGAVHAMVRERPMVIERERVNFLVVPGDGIRENGTR
ncbi:glycosyltransferase family 2 protein [Bradyrhizobium sp. HKCCYLS1011]|uniref:glycosyltransferase family 2 protein n=1 Tax=Bradyrhizobium sp. HKCCYLS1011 TaxID=3420733 RepID=UPI003EBDF94C